MKKSLSVFDINNPHHAGALKSPSYPSKWALNIYVYGPYPSRKWLVYEELGYSDRLGQEERNKT